MHKHATSKIAKFVRKQEVLSRALLSKTKIKDESKQKLHKSSQRLNTKTFRSI